MAVDDGDKPAIGRKAGHDFFDMADGGEPLLAGLLRSRPIGVKPIRRGDRKKAHVATVLPDEAGCVDCARGDGAREGDGGLRVRTGPSSSAVISLWG